MNQDSDVRHFLRAAVRRLETADILFKHKRFLDAVYIAGYGPECALKALILSRLPTIRRSDFIRENFRSAKAHRFDYLKAKVQEVGVSIPAVLKDSLRRINSWNTNLRYRSDHGDKRDAKAFLIAAYEVHDWARRNS